MTESPRDPPRGSIELGALLADPDQAGAYFVDARDRESLVEAGHRLGFEVMPLDLRSCADGATALRIFAETLAFPEWFGGNLDALADCLKDLSWRPSEGYVLVLEHAGEWRNRAPDSFETILDILNEAAAHWTEQRIPFWSFLPMSTQDVQIEDR